MGQAQIAPVLFAGSEDQSSTALGGAIPTIVNAVMDKTGAARRRPGITAWPTWPTALSVNYLSSGSPVIGMCPFGEQLVFVTEDRRIHAISTGGRISELSSSDADTLLDGGGRPVFVPGRNMLVIAGGGEMQKWTGTGLSARLTNTGAGGDPPNASFICAIAQRLVAQVVGKSGQIWWTGPLEAYENWDMATGGAGYIQAAAKPDPLVATLDNTNEVFCFGTQTIQVYTPSFISVDENDPNNVLDFATTRAMNIGTISPYSVVPVDDMFGLVDRLRRAIITDGRTYQDVSAPVASLLREMESIEDAWAFRLKFGRFDALVWMFPTDGYGLLYDYALGNWCEWRAWSNGPKDVEVTSAYNWSEQGVYLAGMDDGTIAQFDADANTDLGDPINIELVSGFTDHGTQAQKLCRTLMLKFKRTQTVTATSGHVRLWMRDDEGAWDFVRDIELGDDLAPCEQIRSLGVYRTRQWKVQYTGSDEIQLVGAQEEFEVLGA